MLPHTFLTGLEKRRRGGVRGGEAGVWLAKEKERVSEGEKRKGGADFLVLNSTFAVAAFSIYSQSILKLD